MQTPRVMLMSSETLHRSTANANRVNVAMSVDAVGAKSLSLANHTSLSVNPRGAALFAWRRPRVGGRHAHEVVVRGLPLHQVQVRVPLLRGDQPLVHPHFQKLYLLHRVAQPLFQILVLLLRVLRLPQCRLLTVPDRV